MYLVDYQLSLGTGAVAVPVEGSSKGGTRIGAQLRDSGKSAQGGEPGAIRWSVSHRGLSSGPCDAPGTHLRLISGGAAAGTVA